MAKDWDQILADAADDGERVGIKEVVQLTWAILHDLGGSLEEAAELVLQHYRHPPEMTRETLIRAATKGLRG